MPSIQFLGAAGTVTGSKFLVTTEAARVLVDCGQFQGPRELKGLNWTPPVDAPQTLDAVVLTHAHLDHAGYFPRLVRDGFGRKAYCTTGTADLLSIMLPDAGFLQEEEAQHANRKGWSRHKPAKPLFTLIEAQRSLRFLRGMPYGETKEVAPGVEVTFLPAGHILGSAIVVMTVDESIGRTTIVFSGDLGRTGAPLLKDPTKVPRADYLLVESTYGDRLHPTTPAADELARVVNRAAERGGMLLIPSFAVGRTQELLYVLRELEEQGAIPILDIFLDSPMAIDATEMVLAHDEEFDEKAIAVVERGARMLRPQRLHMIRDAEQSRAINAIKGPGIIISASGMCTGGRIKHHLKNRLADERNTVCFVGFQAAGTKGRALVDGARSVWIYGEQVPVRAHVERVEGFSAHADQRDLLNWMRAFESPPRRTFVVHGEPGASETLAGMIRDELGWKTVVPSHGELVSLVPAGRSPAERR